MEGNKKLSQLLAIGCKKNNTELEEFVCKLKTETMKSIIHTVFKSSKGKSSQVVLYLFKGMADSTDVGDKRLEVTKQILKEMKAENCNISKSTRDEIIDRITLTVDKFDPEELITVTNICVSNIQQCDDSQLCWKEILPKLLNVLADTEEVVHCGTPITGAEFKSNIIQALCVAEWQHEILSPLAIMFTDIPLSQDEHAQLVNKFCSSLVDVAPNELVTLVQHLMIFCKDRNSIPVFFSLQRYFKRWVYDPAPDPMDMNSIELDHRGDAPAAEASVRLWICESASHGHASVKELVKCVKSLAFCPEKVVEPYMLTLLLALTHIAALKGQIIDALKAAVIRTVLEEEKKAESAWVESLTPTSSDVVAVFTQIITNSHECEKVMNGTVALASALLYVSVAPSLKENVAEKVWALGRTILVQAVKKKTREIGCRVVEDLYNSIKNQQAMKQLIGCVAEVLRSAPHVVAQRSGPTVSMMEHTSRMPVALGVDMVKALFPVIRTNSALFDSSALRDNLIIILRKDLISHVLNIRLIAVSSFLHLLTNLEINSMGGISQSSQSSSQMFASSSRRPTQVVAGFNTNEAICLDLLRVLGRVFSMQAEVKLTLYRGLGRCVLKNPELLGYVHDMLYCQVRQYYVEDEDASPPLQLQKVAILQDVDALVKEPLAHLLLAIHQVITQTTATTVNGAKLTGIMVSLTDRMPECGLDDFGLTDASELTDNVPEGCQKREIAVQLLGVYEALMSYVLGTWTTETDGHGRKLVALFKGHGRLVDFCKTIGKGKKLDANETRKAKGKNGKGDSKKTAAAPIVFKFPATLVDCPTACKMMKLIFEESVDWSSEEDANVVKGDRELRRYAIHVAVELVKQAHAAKEKSSAMLGFFIQLGKVLYQRVICRLQEEIEYDRPTAASAVECFGELLALIGDNYKPKLGDFLLEVGGSRQRGVNALSQMISMLRDLITESAGNGAENDTEPGAKTIPQYLVSSLAFLVNQLPASGDEITQIFDWVKEFVSDTRVDSEQIANGMTQLLLDLHRRCKTSGPLCDNIALQLRKIYGVIDDDASTNEKFSSLSMITKATRSSCLLMLCGSVKHTLGEVDWLINRLRSEYAATTLPSSVGIQQNVTELKAKERAVCVHLSHSIKLVNYIVTINFLNAPVVKTTIFRLLISLYTQLCNLTKYFLQRSTKANPVFQAARFESLVTLCGKHLSVSLSSFIISILNRGVDEDGKKKDASLSRHKSQVLAEEKVLPNIIFQKERFEKFLIKLSTKTKVNLMENVKVNEARDFRIKKGLLHKLEDNNATLNTTEAATDDAANNSVNGDSQPKRKKQRRS